MRALAQAAGGILIVLLVLPLIALILTTSPSDLAAGVADPLFWPALGLSARTSAASLVVVVAGGTPLGWWLAKTTGPLARSLEALVHLPIVLPPAVLGVALLQAWGREGLLGGLGLGLPFTTGAVVLAQVVVAAPFYVQAATSAFGELDQDLLDVARTLGADRQAAVLRVAVPVALPGLLGGAAMAWARALGEFGATLLFAGNLAGVTRTMPLAIYTALEGDLRVAVALSVVLAACALAVLVALRGLPRLWLTVP
jgi:molybdate transport system permease protein